MLVKIMREAHLDRSKLKISICHWEISQIKMVIIVNKTKFGLKQSKTKQLLKNNNRTTNIKAEKSSSK